MKKMINTIKFQLSLLQSANYDLKIFFTLIKKRGIFPPKNFSQKYYREFKSLLIIFISIAIHLIISVASALLAYIFYFDFFVTLFTFLLVFMALSFLYFIFFALAVKSISVVHYLISISKNKKSGI